MAAGNVLTVYSDGRREGPVTISASVDPVALPVPVAFPLLVVAPGGLWPGAGPGAASPLWRRDHRAPDTRH